MNIVLKRPLFKSTYNNIILHIGILLFWKNNVKCFIEEKFFSQYQIAFLWAWERNQEGKSKEIKMKHNIFFKVCCIYFLKIKEFYLIMENSFFFEKYNLVDSFFVIYPHLHWPFSLQYFPPLIPGRGWLVLLQDSLHTCSVHAEKYNFVIQ